LTTTALFAKGLSRRSLLIPLVITPPASALHPITWPPGHMQKE
jgi:hypothetical protein